MNRSESSIRAEKSGSDCHSGKRNPGCVLSGCKLEASLPLTGRESVQLPPINGNQGRLRHIQ